MDVKDIAKKIREAKSEEEAEKILEEAAHKEYSRGLVIGDACGYDDGYEKGYRNGYADCEDEYIRWYKK